MRLGSESPKIDEAKIEKALASLPDFKAGKFTKFEDDMIRKYYPSKGATMASVIGKTKKQMWKRAKVLGVKKL